MRGFKGSRMLPRGRLRRGSKRERINHVRDRLRVKAQHPGGLRDRQALAITTVVDSGEGLVVDHLCVSEHSNSNISVIIGDVTRRPWHATRCVRSV